MKLGLNKVKSIFTGAYKKISAGNILFMFALLAILAGACNKQLNSLPGGGGTDTTGNGGDTTGNGGSDSTGGHGDSIINIDDSPVIPKDYNIFGLYPGPSATEDIITYTGNPNFQYDLSNSRGISLARYYGSKYFRLHVSHDRWSTDTGKINFINFMQRVADSGLLAVLNVNWNETDKTPDPFPAASDYEVFLREVLDSLNANKLKPYVVVVENEPANFNNHVIDTSSDATIDVDVQKYIDELAAAIPICKTYPWWDGTTGVKICDGGYMVRQMTFITYDWLKNVKKSPATATYFASNAMPPSLATDIQKKKYPDYISVRLRIANDLINGMKGLDLDYINLHWQEPAKVRSWDYNKEGGDPYTMGISPDSISKDVLAWVVQYFKENLPKPIISNEIGQLNTSVILNKNVIASFLSYPDNIFPIACWYDADGNNSYDVKALHNTLFDDSGKTYYQLRPTGIQFQQTLKGLK